MKANVLRALAEGARESQDEKRLQEAGQALERVESAARQKVAGLLRKCRQEALAAAEGGKTSVSVRAAESDFKDELYEVGLGAAILAAESLEKDEFSVSVKQGRYVGTGSDPYPSHYYVDLEISF